MQLGWPRGMASEVRHYRAGYSHRSLDASDNSARRHEGGGSCGQSLAGFAEDGRGFQPGGLAGAGALAGGTADGAGGGDEKPVAADCVGP